MVENLTTDVLVVGAGPAGSMTAKWAAKSRRPRPDDREAPGDRLAPFAAARG